MPELPEVETVRRGLDERVVGRTITEATVTGRRSVRRQPREEFTERITKRTVESAGRRGKFLFLGLDDGQAIVVHLRMSGQLIVCAPDAPVAPHTHVTLALDDGSELRFVDPRTFGELFVTSEVEPTGVPAVLGALGPDPLVDGFDAAALAAATARRTSAIKTALLDQGVVAGIGSLYADEICFLAQIDPARPAGGLTPGEYEALVVAADSVLLEAVAHRGSSLKDERYCDLFGELGTYQRHHAVYGRTGLPCPRCRTPIVRTRLAGRSAHFCPVCQH